MSLALPGAKVQPHASEVAMGFSSFTCAKTNLPILNTTSRDGHPFAEVVLLERGRAPVRGGYDGYGRIGCESGHEVHLYDEGYDQKFKAGEACLVIARYHAPTDRLEYLGRSRSEPGQGHFHDDDFIEACERLGGFKSYLGYFLAYHQAVSIEDGAAITRKAEAMGGTVERMFDDLLAGHLREATGLDLRKGIGLVAVPLDPDGNRFAIMTDLVPGMEPLAVVEADTVALDAPRVAAAIAAANPASEEGRDRFVEAGEEVARITHMRSPVGPRYAVLTVDGEETVHRDAGDALRVLAALDGFAETVARHRNEHYGMPGGDREIQVEPVAPHAM